MSNDNGTAAILSLFLFIGAATAWIGSGISAWNFIEPESFGGAILFLIAWAVFGYIAQLILMGLVMLVFGNRS